MPDFKYQCINKRGENLTGFINAPNIEEAGSKLKSQGLTVISLQKNLNLNMEISFFKPKVGLGDLSMFCRQLSSLLAAGIPLLRSIASLAKQVPNPTLAQTLSEIAKSIEEGSTFTAAIKKYPKIFPGIILAMIEAGEVSGNIEESLSRIANQLHKEKTIIDTIKSAMMYPKIIIGFAGLVFLAILLFIVPTFENFLPVSDKTPIVTRWVFALSHSIKGYWYIWITSAVSLFIGLKKFFALPFVIKFFDNFKIKMPLLGELFYKTVVARFIRSLSSLLDSGIPLIQALQYAGPVAGNYKFKAAADYICEKVQEGKNLTDPFIETGLFQPMVINMISAGEEAGTISSMLSCLADFYEEEVTILTKGIFSLLEPLLIIFVAIAIGGILLALYLPIFSVVTGAK